MKKHKASECYYCQKSKRPVGRPMQLRDGWAAKLFWQNDPLVSGLASRGEAFKVLWAVKHKWASVTVNFMNGRTRSIEL